MKARSFAAALGAAAVMVFATTGTASAWAPASSATITPGVQTYTEGAQCTANFIFQSGSDVFIGQAAHCSGTGGSTETNGCDSASLPLGTPVEITGASKPGTLVYNSWIAMQNAGETNADACAGNDFALVKIDPADVGKVNPSVPFWGGPTGIASSTALGEKVLSYGNSSLRGGVTQLSPKEGISLGSADSNGGWTHPVYTVTPGIPGDSGSGFFNKDGKAFGVLSVLEVLPRPASNGVADLSRALSYASSHGTSVSLVNGTEAFRGPLLPLP